MADSPVALATHGTSVVVTRVLVFCVAAFLAAISGALFGGVVHTVTSSDFTAFSSLTLLALLVIMPGREPWYAFAAGFALVIIPSWISTGATVGDWLNVLFGVAAVQVAHRLHAAQRAAAPRSSTASAAVGRRRRRARPKHPRKLRTTGSGCPSQPARVPAATVTEAKPPARPLRRRPTGQAPR